MRFVEEVVVEEFLPAVRALLAADLRDRGLTQSEVAELLGVSQSAVSKYATGEVSLDDRVVSHERVQDLIERLGAGLAAGTVTPVQALAETEVLIRELERGDLLASLHEEAFPALADYDGEFAVHDPDSRLRESERVLASVRRGVSILENAGRFAALIPAVGSNLVEALPGATSIDDVAAVPGRILAVKGRATVPADPEFGVSEHVAGVLLAARRAGSGARAAVNVRSDPDLLEALRERGHATAEFDASAEADAGALGAAIRDALLDADPPGRDADAHENADGNADVDVLYQTGGFGIEPVAYVLDEDAASAAATVRAVA